MFIHEDGQSGPDLAKLQICTKSGLFVAVESGDYKVVAAGGGAGGCAYTGNNIDSLGGASGAEWRHALVTLTAGQSVSIVIGAFGNGGVTSQDVAYSGYSGGDTSFGSYLTALGGRATGAKNGADGGTGGGAARFNPGLDIHGGPGGVNGGDGAPGGNGYLGGTGQGPSYAEALAFIDEIEGVFVVPPAEATVRHPQGGRGVFFSLLLDSPEFGRAGNGNYFTGDPGQPGLVVIYGPV